MVDFAEETQKIAGWQSKQGWKMRDPFTHLTSPELFVGFDEILKKLYMFTALGKNYAVIYGQYGYGKTALIKKIANEFSKEYNVILFEDVPEREYIAEKIKKLCPGKLFRKLTFKKLDSYDYASFNRIIKKRTVLIFDEAHSLDEKTFSYVRSLSENGSVFSVIFAGKPELVTGPKVIPQYLLDRLELSEGLRPLDEKEAIKMIKLRISHLAKSENNLFTEEAMKKIVKKSRFIPREILENCSKLVEFAVQNNTHEITGSDVDAFFKVSEKASVPSYSIENHEEAYDDYVKTSTYERLMEGSVPKHTPRSSYNIERENFLRALSPLQKQIIIYLFKNEPKTAKELSVNIDATYDTIRHMLKRLQGKYNEAESKKEIGDLFPLIEENENPSGRGYIYSLSIQTRKVLSTD